MNVRVLSQVLALVALPSLVQAQDRSGVRPEVLSLPTGPGSIEGLGESFEPNANTGTSSYLVGITVPPGVAGLMPNLGLHYSSGSPNGELGLGWSLGLPTIQLATDTGIPRYDGMDRYVVRGMGGAAGEDIVRMPDGYYRFRVEGAFARAEHRTDGSWEVRNRSGMRFRFGTSTAAKQDSAIGVFSWLLTEQVDTNGNRISYEWERDPTNTPYLARVVYNDFGTAVRNVVEFTWEDRPDPIVSYASGFALHRRQRLATITVTHGGELVRRYTLLYDNQSGLSRLAEVRMVGRDGITALPTLRFAYAQLQTNAMSIVTMADAPARAFGATSEMNDIDGDALPDLLIMDPTLDSGSYSYYPNLDGRSFGAREVMVGTPSVWLDSPEVQLADLDGDGASDVVARVSSASDGFRFYPANSTGFGNRVTLTPNLPSGFSDVDTRLVDLNHDRLVDWMRTDSVTGGVSIGINQGNGTFSTTTGLPTIDANELVAFSRGAQLVECNGDGLMDVALLRSASFRCWPSMGYGRFD